MILFSSGATRTSRSPSRSNSFPANGHKCIPAASLKFSFQQSVLVHPTLSRSGMMEMPEGTEDGFPQPVLMGPSSSRPADASAQTSSTVRNFSLISANSSASILFSLLFFRPWRSSAQPDRGAAKLNPTVVKTIQSRAIWGLRGAFFTFLCFLCFTWWQESE